jgi:adenine-specific DNA-methyltransferase
VAADQACHHIEKPHRYHFGTHGAVQRPSVSEYLIVGG